MTSEKQIQANQQNAQKSTGPKDTTKTRFNAVKHGFRGKFLVLPHECQEEYDDLLNGLLAEWDPQGLTAYITVVQLAQAMWLQMRAVREDNRVPEITEHLEEQSKQSLLMAHYRTKAERTITRLIAQLVRLKELQDKGILKPLPDEAFRPELLLSKEDYEAYMEKKVPQLGPKPTKAQNERSALVTQCKLAMRSDRFNAENWPADVVQQADIELSLGDTPYCWPDDQAEAS